MKPGSQGRPGQPLRSASLVVGGAGTLLAALLVIGAATAILSAVILRAWWVILAALIAETLFERARKARR